MDDENEVDLGLSEYERAVVVPALAAYYARHYDDEVPMENVLEIVRTQPKENNFGGLRQALEDHFNAPFEFMTEAQWASSGNSAAFLGEKSSQNPQRPRHALEPPS